MPRLSSLRTQPADENKPVIQHQLTSLQNCRVILLTVNYYNKKYFHRLIFADLEVVVGSECKNSLDDTKESTDDDSCTAPLSPKVQITDI